MAPADIIAVLFLACFPFVLGMMWGQHVTERGQSTKVPALHERLGQKVAEAAFDVHRRSELIGGSFIVSQTLTAEYENGRVLTIEVREAA